MLETFLKKIKGFNNYCLLVITVIVLTIAIQSIIQFSLAQQRQDTLRINIAGRQRMLSQMIVKIYINVDIQHVTMVKCDWCLIS
jgi:hypothetical protein